MAATGDVKRIWDWDDEDERDEHLDEAGDGDRDERPRERAAAPERAAKPGGIDVAKLTDDERRALSSELGRHYRSRALAGGASRKGKAGRAPRKARADGDVEADEA